MIEVEDTYVALIPFDSNLAPLIASAQLTRDYIFADRMFNKLLEDQTQHIPIDEESDKTYTKFHPDLKFWFKQKIDIAKSIAKLNMAAGVKEIDTSLDLLKIILTDKNLLTAEQRKNIAKQLMEKRLHESDNHNNAIDVSNYDNDVGIGTAS